MILLFTFTLLVDWLVTILYSLQLSDDGQLSSVELVHGGDLCWNEGLWIILTENNKSKIKVIIGKYKMSYDNDNLNA